MSTKDVFPDDVIAFWFGPAGSSPMANAERWWKKDPAFDREVGTRFGAAIEAAARGELETWRATSRGRLALVILLDQFSRNAFRDTSRAFAQDALAREVASVALAAGDELTMHPIQAGFLLMPFMHAEDPALQQRCIAEFCKLGDASADESLRKNIAYSIDFAKKHAAIIDRFGRFPHRNAILGRPSTPEEIEFLKQPGSSF